MGRRQHGQAQPAGSPAPFRPTFTHIANYLFVAAASGLTVFYTTHQAFQQANQDAREARLAVERLTSDVKTLEYRIDRKDCEIRELYHFIFFTSHNSHLNNERTSSWPFPPATPATPRRPGS